MAANTKGCWKNNNGLEAQNKNYSNHPATEDPSRPESIPDSDISPQQRLSVVCRPVISTQVVIDAT
jgi:hypothetical protein